MGKLGYKQLSVINWISYILDTLTILLQCNNKKKPKPKPIEIFFLFSFSKPLLFFSDNHQFSSLHFATRGEMTVVSSESMNTAKSSCSQASITGIAAGPRTGHACKLSVVEKCFMQCRGISLLLWAVYERNLF